MEEQQIDLAMNNVAIKFAHTLTLYPFSCWNYIFIGFKAVLSLVESKCHKLQYFCTLFNMSIASLLCVRNYKNL